MGSECVRELIGDDLPAGELARLARVHTLLLDAAARDRDDARAARYHVERRGAVSPNGCRSSVRLTHEPGRAGHALRGGRNLRLIVNHDAQSKGDSEQ